MTIGDLFDLIEGKLKTGEFNRMDVLYVSGGEDWYPVEAVTKTQCGDVVMIEVDAYMSDSVMSGAFDDE